MADVEFGVSVGRRETASDVDLDLGLVHVLLHPGAVRAANDSECDS